MKIQEDLQFSPDWYRKDEVVSLVKQYYVVLRSVRRARAELRRCVTRCRHCGIFFLTHPRNAGRRDLGCPFRSEEHTSELQSLTNLVCRLLLEKKKQHTTPRCR